MKLTWEGNKKPTGDIRLDARLYGEASPFIWAINNVILPEGDGKWDFDERRWQVDILDDTHPSIVGKKPAQVGFTTISWVKALWFAFHRRVNVIWTFPRQDDVTINVQSRFMPMLNQSPNLVQWVGRTRDDPKSVRLLKFRVSYIYFQEASVEPRAIPADLLVNDEIDLSDPDNLDAFPGRLAASPYKYHYRFSTPTIPGYGVDALYHRETDCRHWMVKCPHCNHHQTLKWDVNFIKTDDKMYYGCEKCTQDLTADAIINGEWVAMYPNRAVHGYHVTGLMLPISHPPELMWREFQNRRLRNFYNIMLGEVYEAITGSLDRELIVNNCFTEPYSMQRSATGNTYMGVDQARDLHVLVGIPVDDRIKIVYGEVIHKRPGVDSFERLGQLMTEFNVRFCVIDATPNLHSAMDFAHQWRGRVALKYDTEAPDLFRLDEEKNVVHLSRTQNIDGLREDIVNKRWGLWGNAKPLDPLVNEIMVHCGNVKRDEEERRTRYGAVTTVGVWKHTGPDHFLHAWAYLRAAILIRPQNLVEVRFIGGNTATGKDAQGKPVKGYKESEVWPGLMIPLK